MKCAIYRNLHRKGTMYSIRALEGPDKGLVVGYGTAVTLSHATYRVCESGRQRALKTGVRNVHATIVGDVCAVAGLEHRTGSAKTFLTASRTPLPKDGHIRWVRYNPHKSATFVALERNGTYRRIERSDWVIASDVGVYASET